MKAKAHQPSSPTSVIYEGDIRPDDLCLPRSTKTAPKTVRMSTLVVGVLGVLGCVKLCKLHTSLGIANARIEALEQELDWVSSQSRVQIAHLRSEAANKLLTIDKLPKTMKAIKQEKDGRATQKTPGPYDKASPCDMYASRWWSRGASYHSWGEEQHESSSAVRSWCAATTALVHVGTKDKSLEAENAEEDIEVIDMDADDPLVAGNL
jgi:hypothetical protein